MNGSVDQRRRFPRNVARDLLFARRLQKAAQAEGRSLQRPGIDGLLRKLWLAWKEQDIDQAMRLVMHSQRALSELMFDAAFGGHIQRLAQLDSAAHSKEAVSIHQIVGAILSANGNVSEAASNLGISRQAINKRLTPEWRELIAERLASGDNPEGFHEK